MIFETNRDRAEQNRLHKILENWYRVEQTSTLCAYDFRLYRGEKEHAIVEFKQRNKLWDPIKMDAKKIRQLIYAARERSVRPILIIGTPVGYYFTSPRTSWKRSMFKRKRNADLRGETPDEVYEIPRADWEMLCAKRG